MYLRFFFPQIDSSLAAGDLVKIFVVSNLSHTYQKKRKNNQKNRKLPAFSSKKEISKIVATKNQRNSVCTLYSTDFMTLEAN